MANDPYWNNTALLLHGDITGDPNWESATVVDEFTSASSMVIPAATAWVGAPGVIGTYFGRPAMYCNGRYPALASIGHTGSTAFTIEFDYYTTGFTSAANPLFQTANSAVSPYNSNPGFSLWTDAAGSLGGYFHGVTVANGLATLVPNQWQRVSLSYNGATLVNIHVDGVFKASVTCGAGGTTDIGLTMNYCGLGGTGHNNITGVANYFAHLRIYRGTYGYLYPATNYTPVAIKPLYGCVPDSSKLNKTITAVGSARTPYTTDYKFGGGCLRFDGASYAEVPVSTDFAFGTGDFTIEFWLNLSVALFAQNSYATVLATDWVIGRGGQYYKGLYFNSSYPIAGEYDIGAGTWVHCAVTRQNGTLRTFRDGAVVSTTANYSTSLTAAAALRVGHIASIGAGSHLQGLIDDLRITKGVARYTAAFTPPAQALPEGLTTVSGTVLDSAGLPCSRTVNVHSRATGRLLGTAVSNPVTGAYSIGAPEQCYVVVLDSTGAYNAKILDRVDPLT